MKKCIICKKIKEDDEFNKEHIIPESIGGSLTIKNVCKVCNSKIGKEIDSKIINDFIIRGHVVGNKIKNKKNKEKVLFEKLISNENPKIKVEAIRGKHGEFKKWKSNTSIKLSPEDKNHQIYYDSNKNKKEILKEIEEEFKIKHNKLLNENEKKEILYKMNNESNPSKVEFNYTATFDFRKLTKLFIKIAYESAHYILGEKYFDDKIGEKLRKSLFIEKNEIIKKCTERLNFVYNTELKEKFDLLDYFLNKKPIHRLWFYRENNKLYIIISLFDTYVNYICITKNLNLYDFDNTYYFILFYYENDNKMFNEMNELDLAKEICLNQ